MSNKKPLYEMRLKYISGKFTGRISKSKPVIGLVVASFKHGSIAQCVIDLYRTYWSKGYAAYILTESGDIGEFAEQLLDQRHLRIIGNNEQDLFDFCFRKNISVLHYHGTMLGIDTARKIGFKIVYTVHDLLSVMSTEQTLLIAKKLKYAHKVTAVSTFVRDLFCERVNLPKDQVTIISNGIISAESDTSTESPYSRDKLDFTNEEILFVCLSPYRKTSHHSNLIAAMETAIDQNSNIRLLLIANEENHECYEYIRSLISQSKAMNHIKQLPYLEHKYIHNFLRNTADVFIDASMIDGCNHSAIEALFCGIPMILTDVGNADEIMKMASGILVQPPYDNIRNLNDTMIDTLYTSRQSNNTEKLANAILSMSNSLDEYKNSAQEFAKKPFLYGINDIADEYISLYK